MVLKFMCEEIFLLQVGKKLKLLLKKVENVSLDYWLGAYQCLDFRLSWNILILI